AWLVAEGRPRHDRDPQLARARPRPHRGGGRRHGRVARPSGPADVTGHRPRQRPGTPPGHLRRHVPAQTHERTGTRVPCVYRDPRVDGRGADHRVTPLRVIVVDDEQLARDELCYQLDRLVDVETVAQAGNGLEALSAIERHAPDLVFLDVQMPGLTGFEVARRLLEDDEAPAVVFV